MTQRSPRIPMPGPDAKHRTQAKLAASTALGLVFALAGGAGCSRPDRESEPRPPTLVVERAPGQPIERKRVRPAPDDASQPKPRRQPTFTRITGDSYAGWVRRPGSESEWRPDADAIAALEAALPEAFAAAAAQGKLPANIDIAEYERQYRGYRKHGANIIEVQLFCPRSRHLARQLTRIQGGGACFLHTAYDPAEQLFRYIRANPE